MSEVKFSKEHEWISLDGDKATIGITPSIAKKLNVGVQLTAFKKLMAIWNLRFYHFPSNNITGLAHILKRGISVKYAIN